MPVSVHIVPIGFEDLFPLPAYANALGEHLHCETAIHKALIDTDIAHDPSRMQYHSTRLLKQIRDTAPDGESKVLGITPYDLFLPVLTFLFGQAQVNDRAAVFSTFRLRNGFYGLPADKNALFQRALKEGMHELGHTFGLRHCSVEPCAMNASTYVEDIDIKPAAYCRECQITVNKALTNISL